MTENLWPVDFGEVKTKTPVSLLREQANALGTHTANIVVGRVRPVATSPGNFRYGLYLYSAPLAYELPLLFLEHGIELYPVDVNVGSVIEEAIRVKSPDELIASLKAIFFTRENQKHYRKLHRSEPRIATGASPARHGWFVQPQKEPLSRAFHK